MTEMTVIAKGMALNKGMFGDSEPCQPEGQDEPGNRVIWSQRLPGQSQRSFRLSNTFNKLAS